MKTVSKKLLSLLLVAMLLVSAVPFQAFAAEAIVRQITVWIVEQPDTVPANESACFTVPANATDAEIFAQYQANGGKGTFVSVTTEDGEKVLTVAPASSGNEGGTTGGTTGGETSKVTMTLNVYDKNDNKVESKTAQVDAADVLAWQNDVMDNIADILAAFGSSFSAADVASGYANANQVVLQLKSAANPGAGDNVVADVMLKTDYCGNIPAKVGQKYLDVLPTPAKPGQEFSHWFSENLGRIVKADDIIEATDVLTAYWQSPTKYSITFIDERGTEPDVTYLRKVAYGSAIGSLPTPDKRDGYIFVGWKLDATGKIISAETIYEFQGDTTAYAQWKLESDTEGEAMGGNTHEKTGKVYLEIYVNGDTENLKKRVDITNLAADDKITRAEAQSVVKKYITAKKGYTLSYDGLFDDPLWWEYKHDPETNGKEYVVVNRDGDDYVFVMVNNVKTVAADPTNPKTGDMVLPAAMTMMMVSGLAAAAVYVIGKKRRV